MDRIKSNVDILFLFVFVPFLTYLIFSRIYTYDFYFISNAGDIKVQYLHFYHHFHDLIHSGQPPFWSWEYGMGGSFWNDFTYYVLGDIFIWPLLLFPKHLFPELFLPMNITKLLGMSIGMQFFLRSLEIKKRIALIGSLLYTFVGSNYESFYTHYFFTNAAVFFPYIIWGYERILKQKKPSMLMISIAISSFNNFYLMFILSLGLGFYALFRFFTQEEMQKTLKNFFSFHLRLLFFYFIGLGLSMVLFLPAIISYMNSNASVRPNIIYESSIIWSEVTEMLLWKGGLSFLPFIIIPLLLINDKKHIGYGLLGLSVLYIIKHPQISSIFGGFSNPEEFRGVFIFNFMLILVSTIGLNELNFGKIRNLIVLCSSSCFISRWISENSYSHYNDIAFLFPIFIVPLLFLYNKLHNIVMKFIIYIMLFLVTVGYGGLLGHSFITDVLTKSTGSSKEEIMHKGVWTVLPLLTKDEYKRVYSNFDIKNILSRLDNKGDYRIIANYPGTLSHNSSMTYGYKSYYSYNSLIPWNQQRFEMDILAQGIGRGLNLLRGYPHSVYSTTLFANKYYLSFSDKQLPAPPLFGYKPFYSTEKVYIYENIFSLPIGFIYEDVVPVSILHSTPYPYREKLMFQYAVIPNENLIGNESIHNFKPPKQIGKLDQISFSNGVNLTSTDNGFLVESETPFNITIPHTGTSSGQITSFVNFIPYTPNQGITMTATVDSKELRYIKNMIGTNYQLSQYSHFNTVNRVVFNFGMNNQSNEITLKVSPGKFLFKDIEVYFDTLEDYQEIAKHHRKNGLNLIYFSNNKLTGTITADKGGVMFLSIPFSKGWSIKVDGQPVESFPVHTTFTGFLIDPGEHFIELTFIPEGFMLGLILSIISLILAVIVHVITKVK